MGEGPARTSPEAKALVEKYIAAFNARDFDFVESIYAEDATLEDPVGSGVYEGRAAIRTFYEQFRSQQSFLQLTGHFRFATDAVAFSFFCYMDVEGHPLVVEITDTFRFDADGLVKEMRAFWGEANVHPPLHLSGDGQLPLGGGISLVVGAGRRAEACAMELGRRGSLVVIAGDAIGVRRISEAIGQAGGRAHSMEADLSEPSQVAGLAALCVERAGRIDHCVNVLQPDEAGSDAGQIEMNAIAVDGQIEVFRAMGGSGAIVHVVDAARDASLQLVSAGPRSATRINCLSVESGALLGDVAKAAAWLAGGDAAGIDRQIIAIQKNG